jgi:hypothetical protein
MTYSSTVETDSSCAQTDNSWEHPARGLPTDATMRWAGSACADTQPERSARVKKEPKPQVLVPERVAARST